MEHLPIGPVMHAAPIAQAPVMMPAPVVPYVNVYDIHQKNVYESIYTAPIAPVIRHDDTAIILVLFILLVIVSRSLIFGHKC